jgi:uncharacterized membrane protein (DUF4010 family)
MEPKLFGQISISLLLGLLIGLQRQRTESTIGGIRTFPLIAAFGTVCGWLALDYGGWVIAGGLVAIAALLVVSNLMMTRAGNHDAGQTTEIAALLLFGVGAYVVVGELAVAVALGGVIAVLLHFKDPLHAFAARIGERDVTAIMQFVLIVGISLVGYVAHKLLGAKQGALLGGVVGGLVSSTATTVSFARRAPRGRDAGERRARGACHRDCIGCCLWPRHGRSDRHPTSQVVTEGRLAGARSRVLR